MSVLKSLLDKVSICYNVIISMGEAHYNGGERLGATEIKKAIYRLVFDL